MKKQLPLLLVLSLLFAAASSDTSVRKEGGGQRDLPANDSRDSGTDAPTSPADVSVESPARTPGTSVSKYVHRIDVANHAGSCVCIAPGVFITAKHIFEGLRGYQVSIDGQAVSASVTFAPAHDVAIVRIGNGSDAAPVEIGDAEFMEDCTAFGMFSETEHAGILSNDDTLSLTTDAEIAQGDSGGGVFCDDKLVGVIRGKNPQNGRVCYFTPLSDVLALVAPFSRGESANQPPGAESKPAVTIRVAPFYCPPCETMRGYDWSGFDVTWETGGDVERGYPEISWTDSRGTKRWLAGAYTPSQVRWSWERAR